MLCMVEHYFIPTLNKEIEAYYAVEKEKALHAPQPSKDVILCNASAEIVDGSGKKVSANLVNCHSIGQIATEPENKPKKEGGATNPGEAGK